MSDDELKALFETLRQDSTALRQDSAALRQEYAALRQDYVTLRQDLGSLRQDFGAIREDFGSLREEFATLREANAAAHAEARRHSEALAADNREFFGSLAERLEHQIELVAEGVIATQEMLARETADIRQEMRRGTAETQAMIRFSHELLKASKS